MKAPSLPELINALGSIDIYLLDQVLKGRIMEGMTVLDAGCGNGRNIHYLLRAGVQVSGADVSDTAIKKLKQTTIQTAPISPDQFVTADLASLPFDSDKFDVVICSAVLHFSTNESHFKAMVKELWRVLKPGGMFFSRFSTTIGLEGKFVQVDEKRFRMPHGPIWFLADEEMLLNLEQELTAERLEPLKTVLVEQERTMTTWVLRKHFTF